MVEECNICGYKDYEHDPYDKRYNGRNCIGSYGGKMKKELNHRPEGKFSRGETNSPFPSGKEFNSISFIIGAFVGAIVMLTLILINLAIHGHLK